LCRGGVAGHMTPAPQSQHSSREKKLPPAKVNQPQNGIKNTQTVMKMLFIFHFLYVVVK